MCRFDPIRAFGFKNNLRSCRELKCLSSGSKFLVLDFHCVFGNEIVEFEVAGV